MESFGVNEPKEAQNYSQIIQNINKILQMKL